METFWIGILMLGALVLTWGCVTWWLFLSGLDEPVPVVPDPDAYQKTKQRVVLLFLAAALFGSTSGQWDVAWHMRYGIVVDDFWWAPHIMLYTTFGVIALIALFGLTKVMNIPGSIRARFRAEPLLGSLFLFSLYQILSGPVDEVWHRIYGKDISGFSLPHIILVLFSTLSHLTVAAMQVDISRRRSDRGVLSWLAIVPLVGTLWGWVIITVGDWEMILANGVLPPDHPVLSSPAWAYILRGLIPGAFMASACAALLRRRWAAGLLVLCTNIWAYLTFAGLSLFGNPMPLWATPVAYLAGALAVDLWHLRAGDRSLIGGGFSFALGYLAVSIPVTLYITEIVQLTTADIIVAAAAGLAGGALAGAAGQMVGSWLRTLPGRSTGKTSGAAAAQN